MGADAGAVCYIGQQQQGQQCYKQGVEAGWTGAGVGQPGYAQGAAGDMTAAVNAPGVPHGQAW